MLIELRPEFVAKHWEEIKVEIGKALPPTGINSGISMNKLLERVMVGAVVCWAAVGEDKVVQGFLMTQHIEDYCTGTRSLLLYALSGAFTQDVWDVAADQLYKYAKGTGCKFISAYTKERSVVIEAKGYGFDTDYRFIYKEVK
ncbi:MAG: hypothetical protein WC455_28210 [Dehalococcoidia bacterium]|jgi:hypothetical protein